MQTFFRDEDYKEYLSLITRWCGKCGNRIWAYCLMPNHVHLIVVPQNEDGLCRGVGEAHRRYTRTINFREGWRGHLWQGRFSSFVMDELYLLTATRYIERNPVKAGLVDRAEEWPWSSAAGHVEGRGDAVAEGDWLAERIAGWVCSWQEKLLEPDETETAVVMRNNENNGRPLGSNAFVKRVGDLIGRDLMPRKPGPKPRGSDNVT